MILNLGMSCLELVWVVVLKVEGWLVNKMMRMLVLMLFVGF